MLLGNIFTCDIHTLTNIFVEVFMKNMLFILLSVFVLSSCNNNSESERALNLEWCGLGAKSALNKFNRQCTGSSVNAQSCLSLSQSMASEFGTDDCKGDQDWDSRSKTYTIETLKFSALPGIIRNFQKMIADAQNISGYNNGSECLDDIKNSFAQTVRACDIGKIFTTAEEYDLLSAGALSQICNENSHYAIENLPELNCTIPELNSDPFLSKYLQSGVFVLNPNVYEGISKDHHKLGNNYSDIENILLKDSSNALCDVNTQRSYELLLLSCTQPDVGDLGVINSCMEAIDFTRTELLGLEGFNKACNISLRGFGDSKFAEAEALLNFYDNFIDLLIKFEENN